MGTGAPKSQQKLGLGSGQVAVGLRGTKAGEDTEAEVDGTVWPWLQQLAQDSLVCRRSHKQRLFRGLGSSGGRWRWVLGFYRFQGHSFCGWRTELGAGSSS